MSLARRIALAAAVLVIASTDILAKCPDVKEQLRELVTTDEFKRLSQFGVNTKEGPVKFVTLNHRTGDWAVYRWQAGKSDFSDVDITGEGKGLPRVDLARNERGVFVLTHTTPPLYEVGKTTTVDKIDEIKNLNEIIAAFAKLAIEVVKPGPGAVAGVDNGVRIVLAPEQNDLDALRAALLAANAELKGLQAEKTATIRFLEYAELGEEATPPNASTAYQRLTTLREAFDDVATARNTLVDGEYGKQHSCTAARAIVEKMKAIDWADPAVIQAKLTEFSGEIDNTTCETAAKAAAKRALADEASVKQYLAIGDTFSAIIGQADAALALEADAIENAAAIRRLLGSPNAVVPCDYVEGLIMADSPDQIAFDETGLVKVTLTPVDALGHKFKRRADAPAEVSYRTINPVAGNIGYGIGVIYTPLSNPEFGAVENPANKEEKVIAKTGEKSRAGELALLGTYRWGTPGALLRPGLQFGAGVSDDLATFLGLSLDIGPIFRLGAGITGQHVNELASGQHAMRLRSDGTPEPESLTKVTADTDIQKRNTLKTGFYMSLSISLDGISFFNRPAAKE